MDWKKQTDKLTNKWTTTALRDVEVGIENSEHKEMEWTQLKTMQMVNMKEKQGELSKHKLAP